MLKLFFALLLVNSVGPQLRQAPPPLPGDGFDCVELGDPGPLPVQQGKLSPTEQMEPRVPVHAQRPLKLKKTMVQMKPVAPAPIKKAGK